MNMFEIIAFEDQTPYDGYIVSKDTVVDTYIEQCRRFYSSNADIRMCTGMYFISCCDRSGDDKPIQLMLIGAIDETLVCHIQNALTTLYSKFQR